MVWLILAVVLAVVEIFTSAAIALCLAAGAVGAFVAAVAGASLEVQLVVLAITMVVSFVAIPPLMRRYQGLFRPEAESSSNMDALKGIVTQICTPASAAGHARVRIDGVSWQARTESGEPLAEGQRVQVVGYDSIVLIVKTL